MTYPAPSPQAAQVLQPNSCWSPACATQTGQEHRKPQSPVTFQSDSNDLLQQLAWLRSRVEGLWSGADSKPQTALLPLWQKLPPGTMVFIKG